MLKDNILALIPQNKQTLMILFETPFNQSLLSSNATPHSHPNHTTLPITKCLASKNLLYADKGTVKAIIWGKTSIRAVRGTDNSIHLWQKLYEMILFLRKYLFVDAVAIYWSEKFCEKNMNDSALHIIFFCKLCPGDVTPKISIA